jgi:uncharacterized protein
MHPVRNVYDGIFNTVSGQTINLRNPSTESIDITDIASALSKLCRFGGNTTEFYSVAQHSVLVALIAPENCKLEALMHDATEAYLGDVISPLKQLLREYKILEASFQKVIDNKFNLVSSSSIKEAIKGCDKQMLELEHLALQQNNPKALATLMHKYGLFEYTANWAWKPLVAERIFIEQFNQYILERR